MTRGRRRVRRHRRAPRYAAVVAVVLALTVVAAVVGTHHQDPVFSSRTGSLAAAGGATAAPEETVAAAAVPSSAQLTVASVSATTSSTKPTKAVQSDNALPQHSGTGRRVVYSISQQRVWTIGTAGNVQRSYLVSGRLSQPGPGHYRVYSKSRWTSSSVSAETMQYMVRFTHGERTGSPIGFHSIPRDYAGHRSQSVEDLGKPLSAGCIRQRMRDAVYLWGFAHVGTRVVVTR